MADQEGKDQGRDYILMGPQNENGSVTCIRHRPDHSVNVGIVTPVKDGVPIAPGSELLQLTKGDGPGLDVEVIYRDGETRGKGPAKVTSQAYRDSWDRIFGTKPQVGSA